MHILKDTLMRLNLILMVVVLSYSAEPEQEVAAGAKPRFNEHTSVLEGRCAVIVRPDNKKLQLMRKGSKDDYATVVNDNEYYMGTAIAFLDSSKMRQIEKPAHGVVIFRSSTGRYFKIPLASFYWGIILFNGRTKPIEADVTDIGADYRTYMKK